MTKKKNLFFLSLFIFVFSFIFFHHSLLCFGAKALLRSHLPKGIKVDLSCENTKWTVGGIVFYNVEIAGNTKEKQGDFIGKLDELQIGWALKKDGLHFNVHLQRPKIELFGKTSFQPQGESLYPLLHRLLFKTPLTIEEGEFSLKESPLVKSFFALEKEEGGLEERKFSFALQRGHEKFSPIVGKFAKNKEKGSLIFHWIFSEVEVAPLFQMICSIAPFGNPDWQIEKGRISGDLSFTLFPKDQIKDLLYHLNLFDFSLFHHKYQALLTLHHLKWEESLRSNYEKKGLGYHPFFTLIWPYFIGEGEFSGAQIKFLKEDQKEILATVDLWGETRFSTITEPMLLLKGMFHLGDHHYPLALIGEGVIKGDRSFKVAFDLNLSDEGGKQTNAYVAWTSQEGKKTLLRGDLTNFNLDQARFLKSLLIIPFPQLQCLEIEGGNFDASLLAWVDGKKLSHCEVSRFIGRDTTFSFPSKGISCDATQIEARGEFDFTLKDFFDGNCWEVKISSKLCSLSPEVKIEQLEAELSMHDEYIKPSWIKGKIARVEGKAFLEGFYHNLNINVEFPIDLKTIQSTFFPGFGGKKKLSDHFIEDSAERTFTFSKDCNTSSATSSSLGRGIATAASFPSVGAEVPSSSQNVKSLPAQSLTMKWMGTLRLFEEKSCLEGSLHLVKEEGEKDAILFGVLLDPKELLHLHSFPSLSSLQVSLSEGWFSAKRLSHHTFNLLLASWEEGCKGEGKIDLEGTFDREKIAFSLNPSDLIFHSPSLTLTFPKGGNAKELTSFFVYDFQKEIWKGNLPIRDAIFEDHSFGLHFQPFSSDLDIEGNLFTFRAIETISQGVSFQGNASLDYREGEKGILDIFLSKIEGSCFSAQKFLQNFSLFSKLDLPLQGVVKSRSEGMHLRAELGKEDKLLDWEVSLAVSEGKVKPLSHLTIKNITCEIDYSQKKQWLQFSNLQGELTLGVKGKEVSYEINTPYFFLDVEKKRWSYDLKVEAHTHDILRLLGEAEGRETGLRFLLNQKESHLFGTKIDHFDFSLDPEWSLASLGIQASISCLDLYQDLNLLNMIGVFPFPSSWLEEVQGPKFEGELAFSVSYHKKEERLSFEGRSKELLFGRFRVNDLLVRGDKEKEHFHLHEFRADKFLLRSYMSKEEEKWNIPSFTLELENSKLSAKRGFFENQKLSFVLDKVHVDFLQLSQYFPSLHEKALSYLSGILTANGKVQIDFSEGWKNWTLLSHLNMQCQDFGKSKLQVVVEKPIFATFQPQTGFSLGEVTVHFSHKSSPQLWAKSEFKKLSYSLEEEKWEGKEVQFIIPPEMIHFLTQTGFFPFLKYEEGKISCLGTSFDWENQIEGEFDFQIGKELEMRGGLKEGYYWIKDKSWPLRGAEFLYKDKKLHFAFSTSYEENPLYIEANLSFSPPYSSQLLFREKKEEMRAPSLVISSNWNEREGLYLQSVEGSFYGLDLSFHHNAKGSSLEHTLLSGQGKIDLPTISKFLPKKLQEAVQSLGMGKGYELSGDLILSKKILEESKFSGYLRGKHFELMGSEMATLLSNISIDSKAVELSDFKISDEAGIFIAPRLSFQKKGKEKWHLAIPQLSIQDFRPSLLKKTGKFRGRIKPLTIRELEFNRISGELGDVKSFTGEGELTFINTFKRDYNLLDIPLEIVGRLGLDLGLLVPIRGKVAYKIEEGRVYLTDLSDSYSEGKRSKFYLSPHRHSFIDFDGNINVNVKMKQYVLLKITEPFTLSIIGTLDQPKYSLK